MQQEEPNKYVKELTQEKYKYGFTTEVHTDVIERGRRCSSSDFIEKR